MNNVIVVSPEVVRLYNDPEVRAAARKVVAPLEQPGINTFQVKQDGRVVDEITRDDLPAFSESIVEQRITGSDMETVLQVVKRRLTKA